MARLLESSKDVLKPFFVNKGKSVSLFKVKSTVLEKKTRITLYCYWAYIDPLCIYFSSASAKEGIHFSLAYMKALLLSTRWAPSLHNCKPQIVQDHMLHISFCVSSSTFIITYPHIQDHSKFKHDQKKKNFWGWPQSINICNWHWVHWTKTNKAVMILLEPLGNSCSAQYIHKMERKSLSLLT